MAHRCHAAAGQDEVSEMEEGSNSTGSGKFLAICIVLVVSGACGLWLGFAPAVPKDRAIIDDAATVTAAVTELWGGIVLADSKRSVRVLSPGARREVEAERLAMGKDDPGEAILALNRSLHPSMRGLGGVQCSPMGLRRVGESLEGRCILFSVDGRRLKIPAKVRIVRGNLGQWLVDAFEVDSPSGLHRLSSQGVEYPGREVPIDALAAARSLAAESDGIDGAAVAVGMEDGERSPDRGMTAPSLEEEDDGMPKKANPSDAALPASAPMRRPDGREIEEEY